MRFCSITTLLLCITLLAKHEYTSAADNYDCKARNVTNMQLAAQWELQHTTDEIIKAKKETLPKWIKANGARLEQEMREKKASGAPEQIHLSMTNKISEMVVMWVTFLNNTVPLQVEYDVKSGAPYALKQNATMHTYSVSFSGWNGFIYVATLTGLKAETTYFYRVQGSAPGVFSQEWRFKPRPSEIKPFTVAAFGDMGTFPGGGVFGPITTKHLIKRVDHYDWILDAGDIAYAMEYQPFWDQLFRQIEPVAAVRPYMSVVGNHESPFNFTAYKNRFRMPHTASGSDTIMWYSFDYAMVHFVIISSEHPHNPGTPQHDWLMNDLAKAQANRKTIPWIVASFHKPMYCSNTYTSCHGWASGMRKSVEDLFYKYQVNFVFFGHVHAFEMSNPVYNCEQQGTFLKPNAPVYGLLGMGGAIFYGDYWHDPQPSWSNFRESTHFGFTELHFNNTHMTLGYYVDDMTLGEEKPFYEMVLANQWTGASLIE